ncbi:MAG: hypothetical protein VW578_01365 [Flavobacteriaceae bacterium]|jgi:hypothetical protein|nr:hypothetical protein [Flavobacteriia bacterium]
MKHIHIFSSLALLFTIQLTSCTKDDPPPVNEEEVIDRVVIELTNNSTNEQSTYTWNEGDTGLAISLSEGATYRASVSFLNATNPADIEDVTEEVREEADDHFVFYEIGSAAQLAISSSSNDTRDSDNQAIGLHTTWEAKATGETLVRLYLIHEPDNKQGTTRNGIGGETDAQIDLNITIG